MGEQQKTGDLLILARYPPGMNIHDYLPWLDRRGRFAPVRALVFALLLMPGGWTALKLMLGWMGPKPVDAALHETGLWALRLLIIGLAITPLRLVSGWGALIGFRRMIGVGALGYTIVHFGLYVIFLKGNIAAIATEIVLRLYLTIGFISLIAMCALGATSTDGAIRRMGGARWARLHRLVYPLSILALIHGFMQAKIDVSEEVVLAGLFVLLMLVRALRRRLSLVLLLTCVPLAAIITALIEMLWYGLATGVSASRILDANFMMALQPRPALIVALFACALPVAWGLQRLRSA